MWQTRHRHDNKYRCNLRTCLPLSLPWYKSCLENKRGWLSECEFRIWMMPENSLPRLACEMCLICSHTSTLEREMFYVWAGPRQPVTSSYLYWIFRPKGQFCPYKFSDWKSWAPVSSCFIFLSLPSHITPVSISLVLGLKHVTPECWEHLCVSFSF